MKIGYSKKTFLLILLPMVLLLFAQDRTDGTGEQGKQADRVTREVELPGSAEPILIAFPGQEVFGLAIDPMNPAIMYASVYSFGRYNDGIFKSEDGGISWQSIQGDLRDYNMLDLQLDPHHSSTIFAVGNDIHKSVDSGKTWRNISDFTKYSLINIVFDPATPGVLYAGCWDGIYKSRDCGESWRCSYKDPDFHTWYKGFRAHFSLKKHPYIACLVGAIYGYFTDMETCYDIPMTTTDCGEHWEDCDRREAYSWMDWFYIDPTNPDRIYSFESGVYDREKGLWSSSDGGKTWLLISKDLNNSINGRVMGFVMDPNSPSHLFVGFYEGLYASFDGGFHWQFCGLNESWMYHLAFVGKTSRLYVATSKGLYVLGQLPDGHSLVVDIVQPKDQQTIYGIVPIQVEAKDDRGLARVEFFVNGQKLGERNCSGKSVSLSFDWDTRSFALGDYEIFVNAFGDEGRQGGCSIRVNLRNVVLNLQCQKVIDRAWSAKKKYAIFTTEVQNPGNAVVAKYVLSRRMEQGVFQEIKLFTDADLINGKLTYKEPLTRATPVYEYKVEAFDAAGTLIGQSNPVTVTGD